MKRSLFVGDSNVYIFNYLKKYKARVIKFRGSPMKGIVNKNDNYNEITTEIKKYKPEYIFLIFTSYKNYEKIKTEKLVLRPLIAYSEEEIEKLYNHYKNF